MQENQVASLNVQPLTESGGPARTRTRLAQSLDSESKPTQLPSSRFSRCHKHPTMVGPWEAI